MKKTLLVFLCIFVLGAGTSSVYAEPMTYDTPIADLDLFAAAAGDQEIVDYYDRCLEIMNEEYKWDIFEETPPFAERYAVLLEEESWVLLYDWNRRLSPIGYLPVPALGENAPQLVVNTQGQLQYTAATALGEVEITFSFRHNGTDMQAFYEQCMADEDRFHVSYVTMKHGEEGVFYMITNENASFGRSCYGGDPARGWARLVTSYGDLHMEVSFLSAAAPDDAIAFMKTLEIENRMLGSATPQSDG
ncbi:MAG: hypothetical protein IJY20_08975 [Clostridia bacterium]|nr:hypothetical protein [Clostridia bacterium]